MLNRMQIEGMVLKVWTYTGILFALQVNRARSLAWLVPSFPKGAGPGMAMRDVFGLRYTNSNFAEVFVSPQDVQQNLPGFGCPQDAYSRVPFPGSSSGCLMTETR